MMIPGGEPGVSPLPERDGGVLALVSEDLAVGQAGMVVDGGVQVAVADHRAAVAPRWGGGPGVAPALGAPGRAPPAAVGDGAEFLDVHMHQLSRRGPLVPAHHPAGGPVQVGQRRAAVPGQHPVHGGGIQAQGERDPGRAQPLADAQLHDPPLGPQRRPGRAGMRPR